MDMHIEPECAHFCHFLANGEHGQAFSNWSQIFFSGLGEHQAELYLLILVLQM